MLIKNLWDSVNDLKPLPPAGMRPDQKDSPELWRLILFFSFVAGVLIEEGCYPRFRTVFLPYAGAAADPIFFLIPVVLAALIGALSFGSYLIPVLSLSFGAGLAFFSHLMWNGELWAGRVFPFVMYSLLCLPAFFLIGMLGIRASLLLQEALRRSGSFLAQKYRDCLFAVIVILGGLLFCFRLSF